MSFNFVRRSISGARIGVRSRISTSASVSFSRFGQLVGVLGVIVPDRDVVAGELGEARQRADGVVVIVEYGDVHFRFRER